jgi:hypothetical protein
MDGPNFSTPIQVVVALVQKPITYPKMQPKLSTFVQVTFDLIQGVRLNFGQFNE